MKTLKDRAIRGTLSLTLITGAVAFAAGASAGDCSMKKEQKTAQYTATPATQVLGSSPAQSNIVYA